MADDPQHTRHARIRVDALGGGTIEVGGHDISNAVRGFTLTSEVGHMPGILLDLLVFTGETEVEGDVTGIEQVSATLHLADQDVDIAADGGQRRAQLM